ncbi:MAG: cell division protein ZapA [Fimbriimonadaceae bacterium]|nr:cell division protein ZapA [Chitinophagales bacterium]
MSEENGLININVMICDRQYRLKAKPEEEETVRKAAKHISEQVKALQDQFEGKEKQDYLAMYVLMLSVEKTNLENKQLTSDSDILSDLEQLNIQIQKVLTS